jgi:Zn-dependent protease with chaperone function
MTQRMWLFGLLLAVPIVGFGVAVGIQAHFNSKLRSAFHEQYPDASVDRLDQITLTHLCEQSRADLPDLCETNDNLNLMKQGAIGVGVVGLLLLILIRVAGVLAQNSRSLLASIFRPGLYLTVLVLIGLVAAHAAIAMGAIYYGESALINRINIGIILAIGLGAVLGVFAMARSTFSIVRKAESFVIGYSLTREEAPLLWKYIDETADKLGALRPEHIVVGLDPNFFVTESDVVCLSGKLRGRTLYCSLPLCRILSKSEMTSIVGHELGHFRGLDTKFSERFYPIYRGTASSIASLQTVGKKGSSAIALLPAVAVLTYFLESFAVAERRFSRERELAADQAGAAVTSPKVIATALVKVHAFTSYWVGFQESAANALRKGNIYINASKTYADACVQNSTPTALEGIAEAHMSHPTDSHPTLSLRLQSLKTTIADVSAAALAVAPAEAAISYVSDYEKKEEEISHAYQLLLAQNLGINLEQSSSAAQSSA